MKNTLLQSKVVIEEKELRMNQIEALYMSSQDQKDDEVIKKQSDAYIYLNTMAKTLRNKDANVESPTVCDDEMDFRIDKHPPPEIKSALLKRNHVDSLDLKNQINFKDDSIKEMEIMVVNTDSESDQNLQLHSTNIDETNIVIEGVEHKEVSIQAEPEPESH